MCDHPMFKRRIAFGSRHYPWIDDKVDYTVVDVPNARHLVDNQFLGFLQMGFPNTIKDMDDIISTFSKIINNLKSLKKYKNEDESLNIGR